MTPMILPAQEWALQHFGTADLGDVRRTRRLVIVATAMAEHPSGSLPEQAKDVHDLKATYDLLKHPEVTFEAIAAPHWQATHRQVASYPRVLVIGDTTEFDFGIHRKITGLGPTGNGRGRGFLLHSALAVVPGPGEILGLLGQTIHHRRPAPKGENSSQALKRARESEIWGHVIDTVGPPREGVEFVHVLDRGGDNFEVFCHVAQQRSQFVIRASHLNRTVHDDQGQERGLLAWLRTLPVAGSYGQKVPARKGRPAR